MTELEINGKKVIISCMDYEDVIFEKKFKRCLLAVFDGFDEICRRMKEEETAL